MSYSFDRVFGWTVNHRVVVTLFILVMSGISIVGYIGPDKRQEMVPTAFRAIGGCRHDHG